MPVINSSITQTTNIIENGIHNVAEYTSANVNVPTPKYSIHSIVKDDTNTNIGTVIGFRQDIRNNNKEYAVVCLFAKYRPEAKQVILTSKDLEITDFTRYDHVYDAFGDPETATYRCNKLLEYVAGGNATAPCFTAANNLSFTIDGVVYHGLIPTYPEFLFMAADRAYLNDSINDPTLIQYPSNIITTNTRIAISTLPNDYNTSFGLQVYCATISDTYDYMKYGADQYFGIYPFLELPN